MGRTNTRFADEARDFGELSQTVQPCLCGSCTTNDRLRGEAFRQRCREIRQWRGTVAGLRQQLRKRSRESIKAATLCWSNPKFYSRGTPQTSCLLMRRRYRSDGRIAVLDGGRTMPVWLCWMQIAVFVSYPAFFRSCSGFAWRHQPKRTSQRSVTTIPGESGPAGQVLCTQSLNQHAGHIFRVFPIKARRRPSGTPLRQHCTTAVL